MYTYMHIRMCTYVHAYVLYVPVAQFRLPIATGNNSCSRLGVHGTFLAGGTRDVQLYYMTYASHTGIYQVVTIVSTTHRHNTNESDSVDHIIIFILI